MAIDTDEAPALPDGWRYRVHVGDVEDVISFGYIGPAPRQVPGSFRMCVEDGFSSPLAACANAWARYFREGGAPAYPLEIEG